MVLITHQPEATKSISRITIKSIQLLTQSKRRPALARQYYLKFRVADSNTLWRTKKEKETGNPWLGTIIGFCGYMPLFYARKLNVVGDGDDRSVFVVNVYQKHHIGKDKLITTLTDAIGEALQRLKDGGTKTMYVTCSRDQVFEETLGKTVSDGSDSAITIKVSLTESREAADAITKATGALGPDPKQLLNRVRWLTLA